MLLTEVSAHFVSATAEMAGAGMEKLGINTKAGLVQ